MADNRANGPGFDHRVGARLAGSAVVADIAVELETGENVETEHGENATCRRPWT